MILWAVKLLFFFKMIIFIEFNPNKTTKMKDYPSWLFIIILSCITRSAHCQDISGQTRNEKSYPEVTIPRTQFRTLHSELLERDFEIFIKLPYDYYTSGNVYPVVYFTDGNRSFPLVENISFILEFPGDKVKETIVIGIGYPLNDLSDWARLRTNDLTPTLVPAVETSTRNMLIKYTGNENIIVKSGGAGEFIKFIADELIPFMEANYRIDTNERMLAGYSYGGLFSVFFMLQRPGIFSKYFAGSPSLGYDQGVIFKYEKDYVRSHEDLKGRLYMTIGELEGEEDIRNLTDFKDSLVRRNYPGLQVETHVFEGETHQSCYPAAVSRAFKVLQEIP
jgi:uncharacterized protein